MFGRRRQWRNRNEPAAGGERAAANGIGDPRERLLADLPVRERRWDLAGVSTAVLEGGEGPPIVLLHGPGEYAAKWFRVIPDLVKSHRVIAPDLPGHGTSVAQYAPLEVERVLDWLGALIERTCETAPALVGQIVGGAVAARFAARPGSRLDRLVLADTLGLVPFRPAPAFGEALQAFLARPAAETHEGLWRVCAFDLDRLRKSLGERWSWLEAYNLDRARVPGLQAHLHRTMEIFGFPAIDPHELKRIAVPTALLWGRHDLATPLAVAEEASRRFGWALHVVEEAADDPALERPEAFLEALHAALATATAGGKE